MASVLRIGGFEIPAGTVASLDLPVARLHTQSEVTMPVRVVRGDAPGPTLFVSAAIHGDEINGVEIIRRLLRLRVLRKLRGTLIAVPVVNVFGFIGQSRYLPDRRDLNRSFPGSDRGSLAARCAELFMREVVMPSTHGIDLHTGALHRANLPQVRVSFAHEEAKQLAVAFGAPVCLHSNVRDGSLREAVAARGVPMLLYEGGEALRFDEWAIRAGLAGIVSVMGKLEMLEGRTSPPPLAPPLMLRSSQWVRAREGGILRARVDLGARIAEGDVLGVIGDPFGLHQVDVVASCSGVVVGATRLPLVNEGDALFHIAHVDGELPEEDDFGANSRFEHQFFDPEEGPHSIDG